MKAQHLCCAELPEATIDDLPKTDPTEESLRRS